MTDKTKGESPVVEKKLHQHLVHDAEGAGAGAVAGAAIGAVAGPPGIVAGAIIGAIAGALTAEVMETDGERVAAHERELDEEIGVNGGDLGAPNLKHPPAKVGAPSASSAGAAGSDGEEPAEGPMQTPEE